MSAHGSASSQTTDATSHAAHLGEIRVSRYDYQVHNNPSYVETEPAARGKAGRGTIALGVKYRIGAVVVVDYGTKQGRALYHAPSDGSPALMIPTHAPGRMAQSRVDEADLVHFTGYYFRTLAAAKRFMRDVHDSGTLPEDRPATREDVERFTSWLEAGADA